MKALTVAEVIAALQGMPPDSVVCFMDAEYMRFETVIAVVAAKASVRINTDCKGENPVEVWEEYTGFKDDRTVRLVDVVHFKAEYDE